MFSSQNGPKNKKRTSFVPFNTEKGVSTIGDIFQTWKSTVLEFARLKPGETNLLDRPNQQERLISRIISREAENLRELWETFSFERAGLRKNLLTTKKNSLGYLLGFHLPNSFRMQFILSRLSARFDMNSLFSKCPGKKINIFDLGAGTGAMSQTMVSFVKSKAQGLTLEVHLFDLSSILLDIAEFGIRGQKIVVHKHKTRMEGARISLTRDGLNIIILGYLWNELDRNSAARRNIMNSMENLAGSETETLIFILEPAQEALSRKMMSLRDDLVEFGFKVLYPCPIPNLPCPMLSRPKDWCYSEGCWERPALQRQIDKELDVNRYVLGVSGYVFWNGKNEPKPKQPAPEIVVGKPLKPGKVFGGKRPEFEYLLCNGENLAKIPPDKTLFSLLRGEIFRWGRPTGTEKNRT